MRDLVGQMLERYKIEELIGEGGMGTVYRAIDVDLKRQAAIKVMHAHLARQPQFRDRFAQEATAVAQLDHPGIVRIYGVNSLVETPYLAMQFVPGPTLSALLERLEQNQQKLQLSDTLEITAQIAEALDHAHRRRIIHRDMKPGNVIVKFLSYSDRGQPAYQAVVTDFGLVKLLEGGEKTATGMIFGSPSYLSPEQYRGTRELDGRSDLYSLGIILFQLATGQLPFEVKTLADAGEKHLHTPPPNLHDIEPNLPQNVAQIIDKSLAKEPDDRFQTGHEMAQALRESMREFSEVETAYAAVGTALSTLDMVGKGDLVSEITAREPENNVESTDDADQIVVVYEGQQLLTYALTKESATIGSAQGNDIVLPDDKVSPQHARVERTIDGWQVVDLDSDEGSKLAGNILLPDLPKPWPAGEVLDIGPYQLRWQEGGARSSKEHTDIYVDEIPGSPINIKLKTTEIFIAPASQASTTVELFNQGEQREQLALAVVEIPQDWVTVSQRDFVLVPGQELAITLTFHPPRSSDVRAGAHTFRVLVQSPVRPEVMAETIGSLQIESYPSFYIKLDPSEPRHNQKCEVVIQNEGNATDQFSVQADDIADVLEFNPAHSTIEVAPGVEGRAPLTIKAKNRPLFGQPVHLPFDVSVQASAEDSREQLSGDLRVQPAITPGLLLILVAILAFCCLGAFSVAAFQPALVPEALAARLCESLPDNAGLNEWEARCAEPTPEQSVIGDATSAPPTITAIPTGITAPAALISDGPEETDVTTPPAAEGAPVHDPQIIVFDSTRGLDGPEGVAKIYLMRGDGSGVSALAYSSSDDPEIQDQNPNVSPDGQWIAFESKNRNTSTSEFEIKTMRSDGDMLRPLTKGRRPSWAPNGEMIAYELDGDIWVAFVATDPEVSIIRQARLTSTGTNGAPAWTADGTKVAMMSVVDGTWQIATVDLNNPTDPRPITSGSENKRFPSWSPSGDLIAYSTATNCNLQSLTCSAQGGQIWTTQPDGENARQITTDGDNADPTWSADGKEIVFHRRFPDGNPDTQDYWKIFKIGVDGSELTPLTSGSGHDQRANWAS